MKLLRLYCGSDGHCHFEEIALKSQSAPRPFSAAAPRPGFVNALPAVAGHPELRTGSQLAPDFHVATRRNTFLLLEGRIGISNTLGDTHFIGPGDMVFIEDLDGDGHLFKLLEGEKWAALVYGWADQSYSSSVLGQ